MSLTIQYIEDDTGRDRYYIRYNGEAVTFIPQSDGTQHIIMELMYRNGLMVFCTDDEAYSWLQRFDKEGWWEPNGF